MWWSTLKEKRNVPHFGTGEILLILLILVLVFGASRLPQIGEGFGKAIKNFKRGLSSEDDIKVSSSDKQISSQSSARTVPEQEKADEAELVDGPRNQS
ncbi:MAG: twin-arginine translocase TatA/TatE family subunit [Myxococcales bacterium]|nr:MAG: twin-arginine translocase TatA/TatE family subunit [Myxococcales bacterium]